MTQLQILNNEKFEKEFMARKKLVIVLGIRPDVIRASLVLNTIRKHPNVDVTFIWSGQHYSDSGSPTTWGVHDIFVQDEVLVHNLEHGGIAIHYDCSDPCPELVNQLADLTNRAVREGLKVLLSPYPGMSNRIMLTAWTFMDGFDVYDEQRIVDFIQSHESSPNAPESFAR